MEKLEVEVGDLVLDLANPRFVAVGTQSEALKALVDFGPNYFRNLMVSIKENGLDPGDAFYILENTDDPTSYIVVDGNRRLAALMVLNEPSMLRGIGLSDSEVKSIIAARAGYEPDTIKSVECVLFDNRAIADSWIERRHGKDLAGEGRLTWGPLEIERFQRDHSNLDVIQFVEKNTSIEQPRWESIKKAVENNSSSLNRFLSNKALRNLIGLTVNVESDDSRVPYFAASAERVLSIMERIFTDIYEKRINTRSYNSAEEIENYIKQLPADLQDSTTDTVQPIRFRDVVIHSEKAPGEEEQPPKTSVVDRTTRAKRPRLQLAERRHPFQQPATTKGQRLILEASKLNAKDFPLASAYTLRAFLEHTIDTYMTGNELPRTEGSKLLDLNHRAELVIKHMIKTGVVSSGQELRGARRILTDTTSPSSIQALNDYHHDRYQIPPSDALRSAWDACLPLFRAVYGAL